MARLNVALPRALDLNANPSNGGKLYVYQAGTTTTVTTYSDVAMTTAQAHPVLADSAGNFPEVYVPEGDYKVIIKTSADVTLRQTDNVSVAARNSYKTLAELAASKVLGDGDYTTVFDGENNEPETFKYDAASTLPANGTTVVTATGMGVGQHISTRTTFKTVADMLADPRPATSFEASPTTSVSTSFEAEGYRYDMALSGATDQHLTMAGGVKLYIADGQWYFEHFGLPAYPASVLPKVQAAIDAADDGTTGRRIMFATKGPYRVTDTILLKRGNMEIAGPNGGEAQLEYVKAAGGAVFAGDADGKNSLAAYSRCKIEGIRIVSVDPATDPTNFVDLTSFSYSYFYVKGQSKRVGAEFFYGQGNAGTAPYWNTIVLDAVFGDVGGASPYSQTAVRFAQGAWAGGSNGPNANIIRCAGRVAGVKGVIDLQSGTGNMIELINAESVGDWYVRLNFNPAVDSGTSTGANTQNTFKDTAKAWGANVYLNDAVKITGGTGVGQVRIISINSADTLTLKEPWGIIPDATSTYEIYEGKAYGNQVSMARGEGLASLNPDFIQAHPGTTKTNFNFSQVESLGSGLFVRDDSGSADNNWFNGDKLVFTHSFINPGPSANIEAYPRVSVHGGVKVPGSYVVEWLKVTASGTGAGDNADVRLDVGGTGPGAGDMTLRAQLTANSQIATAFPGPTEKIGRDGTNRGLYLNLQTGAAFSATVDVQATFCVSLA